MLDEKVPSFAVQSVVDAHFLEGDNCGVVKFVEFDVDVLEFALSEGEHLDF